MKKIYFILLVMVVANATNCGQGPQGFTGPAGAPGSPGTSISIVQFCKGYMSQYPSVFPEIGYCVNGNIYANYWNGSSWDAMIPPGYYESTSTSAPCNFFVFPNCIIQN